MVVIGLTVNEILEIRNTEPTSLVKARRHHTPFGHSPTPIHKILYPFF